METISKETLLGVVSLLGDKNLMQDVQSIMDGEKEEDFNLLDAAKATIISFNNNKQKELIGKGIRKESVKTEKLLREIYPSIDFEGKVKEDMLIELRDVHGVAVQKNNSKDSKEVKTLQDALKLPFVKSHVEALQEKADKTEALQSEFDQYKNLQSVKGLAMEELNNLGGKFSSRKSLKEIQDRNLSEMLGSLPHKIEEGKVIVLDADGDPLVNPSTSKPYIFGDYLKERAPLEFEEQTTPPSDKNPPKTNGNGSNDFGFNSDEIKSFGIDDYNKAKQQGEEQKAAFIADKIAEQAEFEQKK